MGRAKADPKSLQLSPREKRYVDNNAELPASELAQHLQLPLDIVTKYIDSKSPKEDRPPEEVHPALATLREMPEYPLYKAQFTEKEMYLFEQTYLGMLDQFREDVLFAERKQVFQVIELEIFMHRNKIAQKFVSCDMDRLQSQIEMELTADPNSRDDTKIGVWRDQVAGCRAAVIASSKQYNDWLTQHGKLLEKLKSTREQRISQATTRTNVIALLRSLEEADRKERVAYQNEMMRKAMEKERDRHGNYHTFKDGSVSRPYLNHNTVSRNDQVPETKDGNEKETSN